MTKKDIDHIGQLTPDPANARKHTARNIGMIEDALHEVGAARSIVIDEDGVILAGNGLIEAAAQAGIEKVQVVDADGETIIAVRRTGLSEQQKKRLALYDNRTAEVAEWDANVLAQLQVEDPGAIKGLWSEKELAEVLRQLPTADDWGNAIGSLPDGEKAPFQQMTFTVSDRQAERIGEAIKDAKARREFKNTGNENSNGNALAAICEAYLDG